VLVRIGQGAKLLLDKRRARKMQVLKMKRKNKNIQSPIEYAY